MDEARPGVAPGWLYLADIIIAKIGLHRQLYLVLLRDLFKSACFLESPFKMRPTASCVGSLLPIPFMHASS